MLSVEREDERETACVWRSDPGNRTEEGEGVETAQNGAAGVRLA